MYEAAKYMDLLLTIRIIFPVEILNMHFYEIIKYKKIKGAANERIVLNVSLLNMIK